MHKDKDKEPSSYSRLQYLLGWLRTRLLPEQFVAIRHDNRGRLHFITTSRVLVKGGDSITWDNYFDPICNHQLSSRDCLWPNDVYDSYSKRQSHNGAHRSYEQISELEWILLPVRVREYLMFVGINP